MTCIAVIGSHRSGTSAVAGVLHHLGIFMGERLMGSQKGNPKGHFEDLEFWTLHEQIIGDWKDPKPNFEPYRQAYRALVEKREREHQVWGIKDPRLCFTFPLLAEYVTGARPILVIRDVGAIIRSLVQRRGALDDDMTFEKARKITLHYLDTRAKTMASFRGPALYLEYDTLVEQPEQTVGLIARFCDVPVTQAAVDFVDPNLRHQQG